MKRLEMFTFAILLYLPSIASLIVLIVRPWMDELPPLFGI